MRHPANRGERKAVQVKLARRRATIEERAPRAKSQIEARYGMTKIQGFPYKGSGIPLRPIIVSEVY